jgi:Putative zinc-finger
MGHLTEPELSGYRQRTLDPESLLRVAGHLEGCEDCRAKLRGLRDASEALGTIRRSLESHLTAEQLQRFVDRELESEARKAVEQHLSACSECAADAQALNEFANRLVTSTPAARPARRWWWAAVAAVLVITLGLGVWLQKRPAAIAAVNDTGARITLDSRGRLRGVAGLSTPQIESVRRSLRGEGPAVDLSELQPPKGSLMGSRERPSFHLLAPVGIAVRSPTPELRWTARDPAATYVVTLRNIASGQVTSSPPLRALTWTPSDSLQRGALYAWQVAASTKGREEVAPSPPSPQARFLVLDANTVARLDDLPPSHLVRATLYAEAGLLDDARREAEALQRENPESNIVSGLLMRIQTVRRTSP